MSKPYPTQIYKILIAKIYRYDIKITLDNFAIMRIRTLPFRGCGSVVSR